MNPCQDNQFSFTTIGEDRIAINEIPKVKWGDLEQNLAIAKLAEIIYNTSRTLEKEDAYSGNSP